MIYYVTVYNAGIWNGQKMVRVKAATPKEAAEAIVGPPIRELGPHGELVATVRDDKEAQPVATFYRTPPTETDE